MDNSFILISMENRMNYINLFLILFVSTSCNVLETIQGENTSLDDRFFERPRYHNLMLEDDLFGFWRFEEPLNANASVFDVFNGREITDSETMGGGMGRVTGQFNQGISCTTATGLGGTNQMLKSSDVFPKSSLSKFSMSIWMKKDTACSTNSDPLFSTKGLEVNIFSPTSCSSSTYDYVQVTSRDDTVNTTSNFDFLTPMVSSNSSWRHLVINFTRGSSMWDLDVYFDGSFLGSGSVTNFNLSDSYSTLCERFNNYAHGTNPALGRFRGSIDSFGLWTRELTPSDIQNLYNGSNNLDQ